LRRLAQIDHPDQIEGAKLLGCKEVLVLTSLRSQEGGMAEELLEKLQDSLKGEEMACSWLFDRRIKEGQWSQALEILESAPGHLRVMDLGLARELSQRGVAFDLDLQIGHLNDRSVLIWTEKLVGLRRIALNPQMPRRQLLPLLKILPVESEVLGFGPIAMYHTPRKLLSWSGAPGSTTIQSPEMGVGSYPMKESLWGSTLYYNKTLSLLPHLEELDSAGLDIFRIDLRGVDGASLELLKRGLEQGEDIRGQYPSALLHGFYGENKSDSLLDKIGGKRPDPLRKVLAEVMDGLGKQLLVRCLCEGWKPGIVLTCEDGRGRPHEFVYDGGENLEGSRILDPERGDLIKLTSPRKFPPGTFLYEGQSPK